MNRENKEPEEPRNEGSDADSRHIAGDFSERWCQEGGNVVMRLPQRTKGNRENDCHRLLVGQ